jgi:hypothetical protein
MSKEIRYDCEVVTWRYVFQPYQIEKDIIDGAGNIHTEFPNPARTKNLFI